MLIKEATYKKVRVTQTREVTPDIYGCDECSEEIKQFPNEENRLEVKVFHKDGKVTGDLHFCSWECVINHLPKVNTDYFVTLPFMYYDAPDGSKRSASELIEILKKIK